VIPGYLLDTSIISDLVRNPQGLAAKQLRRVGDETVCTSIVVACELRFGAAKAASPRLSEQLERILAPLDILPLESPVEHYYAEIRSALERRGTPIGPNDLLIAAHALALGFTLVTDNLGEFSRVDGLTVENWLTVHRRPG
jgi:tRNA(fMet)-specific endonuclease VapC